MNAGTLNLPSHLRRRLIRALTTGMLGPPYSAVGVQTALDGTVDAAAICAELVALEQKGISGGAVAFALEMAATAAASVPRPDLVWSGADVPGVHARKTRQVFDELVAGAQRSLWLCSYTYFDGAKAFEKLAARMDAMPELQVTLLLNIGRKWGDATPTEELTKAFADKLWGEHGWPGDRRPAVFYDPRALKEDGTSAVLHAKAVVADDEAAFVTSANLTERAFDDNIEVGMLTRDRTIALSLAKHFQVLIDRELLVALPA